MILKNRVAILTRAKRGLGEAIAHTFAQEGVGLVVAARDSALLQQVAGSLPRAGEQKIEWIEADVSRITDIEAIRDCAMNTFGRVDVLVNNAGVYGPIGLFEEVDWRE